MNTCPFHREVTLVVLIAMLTSCAPRSPTRPVTGVTHDNPRSSVETSVDPADSLSSYLEHSEISPKLFWQLKTWEALPIWLLSASELHDNWAETFLKSTVFKDLDKSLKDIEVQMKRSDMSLARSATGRNLTLTISDRTPVYLQEIQDIITYPLVYPDPPDPKAKMLFDSKRKPEAVRRLASMIGMLQETSYLDGSGTEWNGRVIFGSHFIFYHELAHLILSVPEAWPHIPIRPEEEEFAEEIRADHIAMVLLTLVELRDQPPEVIFSAFMGISIAMSFVAAQEYATPYKEGFRQIKGAVFRMARLKGMTRFAIDKGHLPSDALTGLQFYWDLFDDLLRGVKVIPSPVFSLLRKTADRPQKDWIKARNEIVKWCAFGHRESVIAAISSVYQDALKQASSEPRARRAISVIDFAVDQTAMLEPELGLHKAILNSSITIPSKGHR